jgi:anti-anti-sigma regulatory factor
MLEAILTAQQAAGVRHVQVDISAVTTADRAGRAALRNAHRRLADAGVTLMLAGVDIPSWASTTELPSA